MPRIHFVRLRGLGVASFVEDGGYLVEAWPGSFARLLEAARRCGNGSTN